MPINSNNPLVSVIIPTYNRASYVTEAIDSVLVQTYADYEIIVVDDGSTDNTQDVLRPYLDRIVYIYQPNAGVSAARNTGILAAKGEWIAFLDSDDIWLPQKLETHVSAVHDHPDIVAHTVNALLEDGKTTSFSIGHIPLNQDKGTLRRPLFYQVIYSTLAMPPTIFCKKQSAIDVGLFDTTMCICEDYDFMCRLAQQGPWGYDWTVLAKIFRREETVDHLSKFRYKSIADIIKTYSSMIKGLEKLIGCRDNTKKEIRVIRQHLSPAYYPLGTAYMRSGNYAQARICFIMSLKNRINLKACIALGLSILPSAIISTLFRLSKKQVGIGNSCK
jgi:glycosyltransferase involved in cell wall biosynthesis